MTGTIVETTLLSRLRCFLLDMDGTFYLGDRLLGGALRFIEEATRHSKDFLFLTNNSSRDRRYYAKKIRRLGLPIPEDKVFTSGEATALYLREGHEEPDCSWWERRSWSANSDGTGSP